jgi:hypothetical protein
MTKLDPEYREKLRREVAAGVALLDKARPNWPSRIDSERLEMQNPRFCVLGQVYGNYNFALEVLREVAGTELSTDEWHAFGGSGQNRYRQRTWKRIIRQRQAVPR